MNDAEIAAAATFLPVSELARRSAIPEDALIPYGHHMAKIDPARLPRSQRTPGRVVLVTGISPTPAGEGKSTVTVGLVDGLNELAAQADAPAWWRGRTAMAALREPSLGPVFGMKGGATGGGHAQVVPMEEINLHFTGDFHAITAAHNLLCALIDNHLHQGNTLGIDPRTIALKRCLDTNDRALRQTVIGLGGRSQGVPRENGFEITVATETMAVFCLSRDLEDLKSRLSRMIIGRTHDQQPVTVGQLGPNGAQGAMAVLLKDALKPNLVQTLGGSAVLIHGGPFANIAHGANSIIATNTARSLSDLVVTEAGFGADLGGQKFMDITAVAGGFPPAASVVVATVRALKMNGGLSLGEVNAGATAGVAAGTAETAERRHLVALEAGVANLERHVQNLSVYGVPVIVAVNRFPQDTDAELSWLTDWCGRAGVRVAVAEVWARGGAGAVELARQVTEAIAEGTGSYRSLWTETMDVEERIDAVVQRIYRGSHVEYSAEAKRQLAQLTEEGWGHLPVCMAKTQYSFTDDPKVLGAPTGFGITVRELVVRPGAGFIVALTGAMMTMPGLPKAPAADVMDVDADGRISGLF
ncbi:MULTISPECIES: formate--tetrahydrofolate ligase [Micrococcaceae]|uniref:formate--tetrahydrofolate ligase n=1 Tax=Micrococcaceae TaxID=1268 RepID=UPI001608B8D5|nr:MULTISPECIES: formate--tetrahydrofolate ligase [Micrococcaceae]MBB5750878.1 formate--tetrahydrofolate ligase [Micrococcus sp. TA1]HRO92429.1 formate--tetrahydrofolate ligase [Citricoccus sp.]